MRLPIIVNEHGDVSIYRSVEQAERALEAIDVQNGEYVAYDAQGRPLVLSVVVEEKAGPFGLFPRRIENVRLTEDPTAEADEAGLRALLVQFLDRAGISPNDVKDEDISSFVNAMVEKIGYSN